MSQIPTKIDMYNASIPALTRGLTNLKGIIEKAEAHAAARNIKEDAVMNARLALDMFAFARQVQIVTDTAKGAAARLTGGTAPVFEDNETTLGQLKDRLQKTIDYVSSVDQKAFDGSETREVVMKFPNATFEFVGFSYLTGFVLPNFYFHMTTAYDILRHYGFDLGKGDYLGRD